MLLLALITLALLALAVILLALLTLAALTLAALALLLALALLALLTGLTLLAAWAIHVVVSHGNFLVWLKRPPAFKTGQRPDCSVLQCPFL